MKHALCIGNLIRLSANMKPLQIALVTAVRPRTQEDVVYLRGERYRSSDDKLVTLLRCTKGFKNSLSSWTVWKSQIERYLGTGDWALLA